jgi:hypothetical protein
MSDDMNKKIQQIAELLGQENMPDNVKGLLSMLAGSLGSKEEEQNASKEDTENASTVEEATEQKSIPEESAGNNDIMNKVMNLAGNLRGGNDPRINLLHAIKPFMNTKRQKKISNCIQLLQMTSLARLMDNQEK